MHSFLLKTFPIRNSDKETLRILQFTDPFPVNDANTESIIELEIKEYLCTVLKIQVVILYQNVSTMVH